MTTFFKKWWRGLAYEPNDPRRLAGGEIKIVVIGGGTGLSVLLRGLKIYSNSISAIVAVTDDGSSSGSLRKEFDILPPGDIRKCISALAYDEDLLSRLMEYRFVEGKSSLSGHTLGNIWITALSQYFKSFDKAIEATTEIFKTAGKVLPATLAKVDLCAVYKSGKRVRGESNVPRAGDAIKEVFLSRSSIKGYSKSIEAIAKADLIIFGPGSLYTSIIPNLLIEDIKKAIRHNTKSTNVYICNCSTERGETENYSVQDHIKAVFDHSNGKPFDYVLVNEKVIKRSDNSSVLGNIDNITTKENEILGCRVKRADVVDAKNPLYHDPHKLAKEIIRLYNEIKAER